MKRICHLICIVCTIILMSGCVSLKAPIIVQKASLESYKYVYVMPTSGYISGGSVYSGTKSVNPRDMISGILMKEGYTILPEMRPELLDETIIVNYGESGRRNVLLGYTIEVTIQFISAKTNEMICTCAAEGFGETEADDIRKAIIRALGGLFPEK